MKVKEFMKLVTEYIERYHQKPNRIIISKEDFDELQNEIKQHYKELPQEQIEFLMQLEPIFKNVDKPVFFYEYDDYKLTVGELKEFLKDIPDYYEVYIERIEDVYFDKHGWKTEHFDFGNELDDTEGIRASGYGRNGNKIIITAHI